MPLYEYECTSCHRRTEKIQKFSDAELTVCPHCNGRLERTLTAPNVQFKGGGWYKDLYSSAKPAASGGETSGSAAAGESGAASSESSGSGNSGSGSGADSGSGNGAKSGDSAKPAPAASAPAAAAASSSTAVKS